MQQAEAGAPTEDVVLSHFSKAQLLEHAKRCKAVRLGLEELDKVIDDTLQGLKGEFDILKEAVLDIGAPHDSKNRSEWLCDLTAFVMLMSMGKIDHAVPHLHRIETGLLQEAASRPGEH